MPGKPIPAGNSFAAALLKLSSIRNSYGKDLPAQKIKLLEVIGRDHGRAKKSFETWYTNLLFLLAYPDNSLVYQQAERSLEQLQQYTRSHEPLQYGLYNSGVTGTRLCAAFSFEMVKWMKKKHPAEISLNSFDADDGTIQSIISVVMQRVESEIMQDGNAGWRSWLGRSVQAGEDLLDRIIAVFDETALRPEARDELWNAMGLNVEIYFPEHSCLPASLVSKYYHRSLLRKNFDPPETGFMYTRVKLDEKEAEHIIDCSRIILLRHLREIDPITFTDARFVSYYRLQRGISIALLGMVPGRRTPIDSYMGYVVFKNGLPVAYAGSWILFDSGRIGLNIFPAYRGGESQYIFSQVLELHRRVYHLKRFTVDPYQVGKDNSDGIKSGAFWVYYHAGFRPVREEQQMLAASEAGKIRAIPGYRSPAAVLKKLANSRSECILQKGAVRFDATDLSLAYAAILKEKFNNKRKPAEERCAEKLAMLLGIKNHREEKLQYILRNWGILLLSDETTFTRNSKLRKELKKLFELKESGPEEAYIKGLQQATELRKFLEDIVLRYNG